MVVSRVTLMIARQPGVQFGVSIPEIGDSVATV